MIPGLGRSPGVEHVNPFQYSCLENPHGQKSLAGYSPWSHKESDTTEPLSTASLQVLLMKSGEEVVHTLRTGGLIIQGVFNLMEKVLLGQ